MYHIGTVAPFLPEANLPRDRTPYPTFEERCEWADSVAARQTGFLPLCIDHAGGERPDAPVNAQGMFEVPPEKQIGRVVDALVRPNGDLLCISELYYDRAETHGIIDDLRAGRRWGLSLCTNYKILPDTGRVLSKRITHLGVTQNPEFGPENSWIHYAHTSWEGVDDTLQTLMDREPGMYVPSGTRTRLRERQTRRGVRTVTGTATATPAPSARTSHLPPAARLATPLAPPIARVGSAHRPMADTTSSSSLIAPPVTPATPATPDVVAAAPPPSQQQPSQQQLLNRFLQVHNEVDGRFNNVVNSSGEWNVDTFTPGNMNVAHTFMERYGSLLNDAGFNATNMSKWPAGTVERLTSLNKFVDHAKAHGANTVDAIMSDVPGGATPEMLAAAEYSKLAIENFSRPEYLPVATQVMATGNHMHRNQRALAAQLLAKQSEVESKKMELEKSSGDLKRSRDEWDAERKRMQTEYDAKLAEAVSAAGKRVRTETSAVVAAQDNKTAAAAVTVDTMASRGPVGMPDLPNVRISSASAGWLRNLGAANTPLFEKRAATLPAGQTAALNATLAELRKPSAFATGAPQ
jgi:hypothetical protein